MKKLIPLIILAVLLLAGWLYAQSNMGMNMSMDMTVSSGSGSPPSNALLDTNGAYLLDTNGAYLNGG